MTTLAQNESKAPSENLKAYKQLLGNIKKKVKSAQIKAATSVNSELIKLYWEIGQSVLLKQEKEGWGSNTIDRLAKDLKSSFPNMKGFSPRNIRSMVQFFKEYEDKEIVKQAVSKIPWGHNILLMQKLESQGDRIWYAQQTIEHGWSRNVLSHWLDSNLHKRQGKTINNFKKTLPPAQSDLAQETMKDPYNFDFLTLRKEFDEKELEDGLLDHIQKFLIELGSGFAFIGKQVNLNVGGQDFFVDLLFFHMKLRCYVVVELKATEFKPEYAGKMNFYLTAIDKTMKHEDDKPTIGLLLCKTKNKVVAEYSLWDINKPLGVAEYETKLIDSFPEELKGSLPSIEELEQGLTEED